MGPTLQVIINIGAVAIAIAAVVGVPVALVKLWPIIKRMVTVGAILESLPETLQKQDEVLEIIRHEVEFNNGTSVKDAVTRVEKALAEHLATQQGPTTTINVNPGGAP